MVRFLANEFGVATGDIEVMFGRMNVNKQLRIKSPKRLPAVLRSRNWSDSRILKSQKGKIMDVKDSNGNLLSAAIRCSSSRI